MLARYGVETTYFDPLIGAGIERLFKPNTRAVLVEAPGSQSFEMTDIPAIAEVAHARDALVIDDNTWATPLFHRSLDQGVDIQHAGRHQIYRRPFRHHVRHDLGQCQGVAAARRRHPPARRLRRPR